MLCLLGAGCLLHWVFYRQRRNYFCSRAEISVDDWMRRYLARHSGREQRLALAVLEVFAQSIGCNPTQILPTDMIDERLCLPYIDFIGRADDWETWDRSIPRALTADLTHKNRRDPPRFDVDSWVTVKDVIDDALGWASAGRGA